MVLSALMIVDLLNSLDVTFALGAEQWRILL